MCLLLELSFVVRVRQVHVGRIRLMVEVVSIDAKAMMVVVMHGDSLVFLGAVKTQLWLPDLRTGSQYAR